MLPRQNQPAQRPFVIMPCPLASAAIDTATSACCSSSTGFWVLLPCGQFPVLCKLREIAAIVKTAIAPPAPTGDRSTGLYQPAVQSNQHIPRSATKWFQQSRQNCVRSIHSHFTYAGPATDRVTSTPWYVRRWCQLKSDRSGQQPGQLAAA